MIISNISYVIIQLLLLLLLIPKERNDGGKAIFKLQEWKANDIVLTVTFLSIFALLLIANNHYKVIRYSYFINYLIAITGILLLFKYKIKQKIFTLGIFFDNLRPYISLIVLVVIGKMLSVYFIDLIFFSKDTYNKNTLQELIELESFTGYAKYFMSAIIISPIIEEIIYRGILYSPFRKRYGSIGAIIITSLFFALSHIGMGLLPFIIGGIFLGYLYEKTETLIAPIIAHSLYNLLSIITVFISLLSG